MAIVGGPGDRRPTLDELTEIVSASLARDNNVDEAVLAVLRRDPYAIPAIKALQASTGMGLAAAKTIIDRNLPRHIQESNERLRSAAAEVFDEGQ